MNTIDSLLRYCPQCGDEYRAEISLCAACGKELISGADLLAQAAKRRESVNERSEIHEGDTLVAIRKGGLFDMKNLKRLLEKGSVPALIARDENCGRGCCGPEVLLQIRQQDLQRAAVILEEEHIKTTAGAEVAVDQVAAVFDPEEACAVCPACGHEFTPDGPDCPDCGLQFL